MLILAVSQLGAAALGVLAVAALLAVGWALLPFGRIAERFTVRGDAVARDRPEFRRPPDEGGLL